MLDELLIGPFVGLGPGPVHGGAFAAIEHAEVDAGGVDGPAHHAAQGVDFPHDLPLGDTADGRVAAHLGDGVEVVGKEGGPGTHPRSGQGGLAPGVPGSDDDDIVVVDVPAHTFHLRGVTGEREWGRRRELPGARGTYPTDGSHGGQRSFWNWQALGLRFPSRGLSTRRGQSFSGSILI